MCPVGALSATQPSLCKLLQTSRSSLFLFKAMRFAPACCPLALLCPRKAVPHVVFCKWLKLSRGCPSQQAFPGRPAMLGRHHDSPPSLPNLLSLLFSWIIVKSLSAISHPGSQPGCLYPPPASRSHLISFWVLLSLPWEPP